MSSLVVVPPPKLKAYLGKIKERYLDSNTTTTTSNNSCHELYQIMLCMELVQRGILVDCFNNSTTTTTTNDDDTTTNIITKLFDTIKSIAGKSLLDETIGSSSNKKFPKPLLAGASVVAGKIIELCNKCIIFQQQQQQQTSSNNNNTFKLLNITTTDNNNKTIIELYQSTIERCKEVNDKRFELLLKLSQQEYYYNSTSSSSDSNTSTPPPTNNRNPNIIIVTNQQITNYLLLLAQGYYLRASTFQSIVPLMWKRTWDTILERYQLYYTTTNHNNNNNNMVLLLLKTLLVETSIPIINLITIAKSKNNIKRVIELNLKLLESFISGIEIVLPSILSNNNNNFYKDDIFVTQLFHSFVETYYSNNNNTNEEESNNSMIYQILQKQYNTTTNSNTTTTTTTTTTETTKVIQENYNIIGQLLQSIQESMKLIDINVLLQNEDNNNNNNNNEEEQQQQQLIWIIIQTKIDFFKEQYTIIKETLQLYETNKNRSKNISYSKCYEQSKEQILFVTGTESGGSSNSNSSSIIELQKQQQQQNNNNKINDYVLTHSISLLQFVLQKLLFIDNNNNNNDNKKENDYYNVSIELVQQHLIRLYDKAKATAIISLNNKNKSKKKNDTTSSSNISIYNGWTDLFEYSALIILSIYNCIVTTTNDNKEQEQKDIIISWLESRTKKEQQLIYTTITLLPCSEWMRMNSNEHYQQPQPQQQQRRIQILKYTNDLISCLCHVMETNKNSNSNNNNTNKNKNSDTIIQSKKKESEIQLIKLKCAYNTTNALVIASTIGGNNNIYINGIRNISNDATINIYTKNKIELYRNYQGEYGMAYIQCLILWSGIFQSYPWMYCTISEARRILYEARKTLLEYSKLQYGRISTKIEELILDLAQADIESGNISSSSGGGGGGSIGLIDDAARLYQSVLTQIDTIQESIIPNSTTTNTTTTTESESPIRLTPKQQYEISTIILLRSYCYCGLARISQLGVKKQQLPWTADEYADESLAIIEELMDAIDILEEQQNNPPPTISLPLSLWTTTTTTTTSSSSSKGALSIAIQNQLSISRQLVADSLVRLGRPMEAQSFLEDAVNDLPYDPDVSFALGSFRLRMIFMAFRHCYKTGNTASLPPQDAIKGAQIQLLKAAKLDSTKANPFALLGLWFEQQKDIQRSIGCYTKALTIDPPNPIAGRGMLRLNNNYDDIEQYLNAAINTNSPLNGWAWRAIGLYKVMEQSQDELAIVALLKALRSRDIELPHNESLSLFYKSPPTPTSVAAQDIDDNDNDTTNMELADTLADLAMCYRRLGRYTAAIRAFHSASEVAGKSVSSSVLCSCAQVELELGLFDEAEEKFSQVVSRNEKSTHSIAIHGQGISLLSIARRDLQDGKAGVAYKHVQRAIESCLSSPIKYGCTYKLLGDLYSFGFSLPPDVFLLSTEQNQEQSTNDDELLKIKLQFIAKGENAYRSAIDLELTSTTTDDEEAMIRASRICDVGSNILLQAQLLSFIKNTGYGIIDPDEEEKNDDEVTICNNRAAEEFRNAIKICPLHPSAWCGLGCSIAKIDPLLAQHSFCRSLQIDKMFPEAYSNIGFLYVSYNAFTACENTMDALTQVADTPMMWINRALILEGKAASYLPSSIAEEKEAISDRSQAERNICWAADAYRAALQVMKHPSAMLGLSLTCRMIPTEANEKQHGTASPTSSTKKTVGSTPRRKESFASMMEYIGSSSTINQAEIVFGGVMTIEKAILTTNTNNSTNGQTNNDLKSILCEEGQRTIQNALDGTATTIDRDSNAKLDMKSIHGCLQPKTNSSLVEENTITTNDERPLPYDISLQRRILHEPNRPDLWLLLSKSLVKSLSKSSSSKNIVESAKIAANKASTMLAQKLLEGGRTSDAIVDAQMISEALSLEYWLEQIYGNENGNDNAETNDSKTVPTPVTTITNNETQKRNRSINLQRSLMMCPNNPIARDALNLSSS